MGTLPIEVVKSYTQLITRPIDGYSFHIQFTENSLVYDARNYLAQYAIDNDLDYVLWVDSDVIFPADGLERLLAHDKDFVTGVYFQRRPPHYPTIYSHVGEDGKEVCTDYTKKRLFQVEGCGFGFCLVKVDVMRKMVNEYGYLFHPIPQLGEDLSFCYRWTQMGGEIWCDPTIKLGHLGTQVYGEEDYHGER